MTGTRHATETEMTAAITACLEARPDVRLAILFGSAARGKLHKRSDIDIAVALDDNTPEKREALREELAALTHREVDLLDLPGLHGFILKEVLTQGTVVVKRDSPLYELLIKRMLIEEADWLPLKRAAMKKQLERFLNG
ncbi:MAG TPA: nucleotidyltransferase domain-containing protein [bacterium]|nr:nucleotidyltransferase domain-containing protein [bacterium]